MSENTDNLKCLRVKIHEGSDDIIEKRWSVSILGLTKEETVKIKKELSK